MKPRFGVIATVLLLIQLQVLAPLGAMRPPTKEGEGDQPGESVVLRTLKEEIVREMKQLGDKASPPPYFTSYQVTEEQGTSISASFGALENESNTKSRLLDVEVKVGSRQLDNTHQIRGSNRGMMMLESIHRPVPIAIEDDPGSIKNALWLETDKAYKAAANRLIEVKADTDVRVKAEDSSADFSAEKPSQFVGPLAHVEVDRTEWIKRLKDYSSMFGGHPEIYDASVNLEATAQNEYFVNSEGTAIQQGAAHWRLFIYADTKASDGMDLYRYEAFDAHTPDRLPDAGTVRTAIDGMIRDLLALRKAPVIEPYTGPAILSGRAAGVFFHEIFGHRVEGHRQKDEAEGQTFTKKVNQAILPDFISVYDDPSAERAANTDLNGYYLYDDEGVRSERVPVVENGFLRNFLMSRSPVAGFDRSNGHGRKQVGFHAVGRQGNLMVEASRSVPEANLRELLIAECKKQGKPFGLFFKDISGGFTLTTRGFPQAFQVTPIMVYKVYADGRPDELVRGADLIGTPLISFSKIVACGDKQEVFNGYCGAESGFVPVSAVAPSILTTQIEIQKKEKSSERPPLLPPPAEDRH